MIALGFVAATYAATRLAKRWKLDPEVVVNGALLGFIGGVLGARLYFVAISWPYFASHPWEILATWKGGMSIHGGIIGGVGVGVLYCFFVGFPLLRALDIAGCVFPLAQSIGRWGNFFNSEAFGLPVGDDFPLRLFIPEGSRPFRYFNSSFFHPTFLYESIWNLALFVTLYFFVTKKLKSYPGITFPIYLIGYSIGRLLIEPLRVDSIMSNGMPVPIIASIVLIIGSIFSIIWIFVYHRRRGKGDEAADAETVVEEDSNILQKEDDVSPEEESSDTSVDK